MNKYKILKQKGLENLTKFEDRLNAETQMGWKAISISGDGHGTIVLLEKVK